MTVRTRRALVAVAVGLVVAGCGRNEDLSAPAAPVLQRDVAAVAAAARAGEPVALNAALARLRTDVAQRRSAGQLSAARATRILDAAARVALDVTAVRPASPAPSRRSAGHSDSNGNGDGNGGEGDD